MHEAEAILLYDGVCGLCNRLNRFILRRDPQGRFHFAALQSDFARQLLARHGRDAAAVDTFYVVTAPGSDDEAVLDRARAALHVARALGWPWRAASVLGLLPTRLLDLAYRLVARSRYRIFGRSERCELPRPEWADRFVAPHEN